MDFQFLAIWAAQGSKDKKSIIYYGQLLYSVFSCFHGHVNQKHCSVRTKELYEITFIHIFFQSSVCSISFVYKTPCSGYDFENLTCHALEISNVGLILHTHYYLIFLTFNLHRLLRINQIQIMKICNYPKILSASFNLC